MSLFKKSEKHNTIDPDDEVVGIVVLIKVAPSYESKVYNAITKLKVNFELHPVLGEYDFVLIVYVKPPLELVDVCSFVANKIRTIEGVMETCTPTIPKI